MDSALHQHDRDSFQQTKDKLSHMTRHWKTQPHKISDQANNALKMSPILWTNSKWSISKLPDLGVRIHKRGVIDLLNPFAWSATDLCWRACPPVLSTWSSAYPPQRRPARRAPTHRQSPPAAHAGSDCGFALLGPPLLLAILGWKWEGNDYITTGSVILRDYLMCILFNL